MRTHQHINYPKARFKGKIIIKTDKGYLVNGEVFKTFSDATDSIK